ncbi:MAG TPA: hypothetical protein VFH51_18775 [Myxococcota bacterium]|nr:hypothetical protein [Myxococcota bacterium]
MTGTKAFQQSWRYHTLSCDGSPILCLTRNGERYTDLPAFLAEIAEMKLRLMAFRRPEHALLIDSRLSPLPHDVEMHERMLRGHFTALVRGWKAVAIITRTAAGKLQSIRMQRENAMEPHTFDNDAAALAFLRDRLARP